MHLHQTNNIFFNGGSVYYHNWNIFKVCSADHSDEWNIYNIVKITLQLSVLFFMHSSVGNLVHSLKCILIQYVKAYF